MSERCRIFPEEGLFLDVFDFAKEERDAGAKWLDFFGGRISGQHRRKGKIHDVDVASDAPSEVLRNEKGETCEMSASRSGRRSGVYFDVYRRSEGRAFKMDPSPSKPSRRIWLRRKSRKSEG